MAKKNLKSALKAHEAKKSQAARARLAEEAAKRKAASIRGGGSPRDRSTLGNGRRGLGSGSGAAVRRERGGRSQPDVDASSGASAVGKAKQVPRAFEKDDTILLVGEGNFSFARALLQPPHSHPPHLVLATAYDTEEQCYSKYPDAREHVAALRKLAGRESVVAFGIDAGDLAASKAVKRSSKHISGEARWSKIVFNFPHVGAGHKDETRNVLANQLLLLRFLVSCAPLLTRGALPDRILKAKGKQKKKGSSGNDDIEGEDNGEENEDDESTRRMTPPHDLEDVGENNGDGPSTKTGPSTARLYTPPVRAGSILITLRNAKPYTLWDVPTLAKRLPLILPAILQRAPALPRGQRAPSPADVSRLQALATPRSSGVQSSVSNRQQTYFVWRSFVFDPTQWPGYSHRRTVGWREGLSTGDNEDIQRKAGITDGEETAAEERTECRTWELALQN